MGNSLRLRVSLSLLIVALTFVSTFPIVHASSGALVTLNTNGDGSFILTYTGSDYVAIYGMYSMQGDASFKGDIVSWGLIFGWIFDVSTLTVSVSTPTNTITISCVAKNLAKQVGSSWQYNGSSIKAVYPAYTVTGNTYHFTSVTKPDVRFPEKVDLQLPANTISHQFDPNTYFLTYQLGTTPPPTTTTAAPRSGCIIATAAYGSHLDPEVVYMRYVRDNMIGSNSIGRTLVGGWNSFYYSWSPHVARFIDSNNVVKPVFRVLLLPLAGTIHLTASIYSILASVNMAFASVIAFLFAAISSIAVYIMAPLLAFKAISRRFLYDI